MIQRHAPVQEMRCVKAAAFVLAILLVIPGIDALAHAVTTSSKAPSSAAGIDAGFLARAPDAFAALDQIEAQAYASDDQVSDAFSREIGFLPGAQDVRIDGDTAVVGYLVEDSDSEALERLSAQLAERGWTVVPLGGVCGATFVKQDGVYTWALVTCTQVGSATSVVVRT